MCAVNWFRHYHATKNDDARARFEAQSYRTFHILEGQLKSHDSPYILPGSSPSAVDLHFYPWLLQHTFAQLSLDEYPSIKKWLDHMKGLKEIKAAYERVPNGKEM